MMMLSLLMLCELLGAATAPLTTAASLISHDGYVRGEVTRRLSIAHEQEKKDGGGW